jgi:hypothetical protein
MPPLSSRWRERPPRSLAPPSASEDPSSCPGAASTAAAWRDCAQLLRDAARDVAYRFPRLPRAPFYLGKIRVPWMTAIATTPPHILLKISNPGLRETGATSARACETRLGIIENNTDASVIVKNFSLKSLKIAQTKRHRQRSRLCKCALEVGFRLQYSGPRLHFLVDALLEAPRSQGEKRCARS